MNNLVYQNEYKRQEILDGEIVSMSPSPSVNHNIVAGSIYKIFSNYLQDKECIVFQDNIDLHLSEKDLFIPDVTVVCNKDIIKYNGIYGAPNLVVEVLSPSTAKKDKGYKKKIYEKAGIQEYWIVNLKEMSVEISILKEGKYELDNVYYYEKEMPEEEKENIETEIKCSLFEDLIINTNDIFNKVIKY